MFTTNIGTDLVKAKQFLEEGEVVAIPTETVYGLAANALNPNAVAKIFEAKNRPHFDPLIVHLKNVDEFEKYAQNIPDSAYILAERFLPGPLTLLLPKQSVIPDLVTSGLETVGLRIPYHQLTLELLNSLDFPLAAPSANPFGYISPTTAKHVADQLNNKIPYILDGGSCGVGVESTIVEPTANGIIVHRLGGISLEELKSNFKDVSLNLNHASNPKSSGQLLSHYAPKKRLIFTSSVQQEIETHTESNIAVISFFETSYSNATVFPLSKVKDLNEAASNLFKVMRHLDEGVFDLIIAEKFPEYGLGRAINDRLQRAAY